jgi:hypothetical protein
MDDPRKDRDPIEAEESTPDPREALRGIPGEPRPDITLRRRASMRKTSRLSRRWTIQATSRRLTGGSYYIQRGPPVSSLAGGTPPMAARGLPASHGGP